MEPGLEPLVALRGGGAGGDTDRRLARSGTDRAPSGLWSALVPRRSRVLGAAGSLRARGATRHARAPRRASGVRCVGRRPVGRMVAGRARARTPRPALRDVDRGRPDPPERGPGTSGCPLLGGVGRRDPWSGTNRGVRGPMGAGRRRRPPPHAPDPARRLGRPDDRTRGFAGEDRRLSGGAGPRSRALVGAAGLRVRRNDHLGPGRHRPGTKTAARR
jgi:hypothetical protein